MTIVTSYAGQTSWDGANINEDSRSVNILNKIYVTSNISMIFCGISIGPSSPDGFCSVKLYTV